MKQIPNILTLSNLFFGCVAIVFSLTAYPHFEMVGEQGQYIQIQGMNKLYLGSLFIFLAAVMDLLDGWAARLLKAESPIGKDLDSLADLVSFGVAPGVILYQLLWRAYMMEPNAMQTPVWVLLPALLVPVFAAYRLARFNQKSATSSTKYFEGMPTPAAGIFVAILPLVLFFSYEPMGHILEWRTVLYGIIALVCFLMVSKVKFLKWNTGGKGIASFWPQILILIGTVLGFIFLKWGGLLIGFALYLLASFVYRYPQTDSE